VHLQYFEETSRVTAHGNGLEIQAEHFVLRDAGKEDRLLPISGPASPGDIIVTKMTLRVDRDMEYVHVECPRGSGFEPTENLSGYRYQDGIRYYLSIRDIGSHFFIDTLRKGTYVLESRSRAVHKGLFQTGTTTAQCLFAPEFSAHSRSDWIEIR
jgi:uncharacterized protein YfaS (alpha-2-macroglobulin family)